jgi:signal peptidase I
MILRWFLSKTVRDAWTVFKHYRRLLAAQRDLLPAANIGAIQSKLDELRAAIADGHTGKINIKAEELQFAGEKNLQPYPHAVWRENVEVLLVALAVAMGIRTFFLQPFKIPTGSMQPTLFGVTSTPYFVMDSRQERPKLEAAWHAQQQARDEMQIPTGWARVKEWFAGASYIRVVAQNDGELEAVEPPVGIKIINFKQTLRIGGVEHTIWFPPDYGDIPLPYRAGIQPRTAMSPGQYFHKGDEVVKMRVNAGDHLFVDRLTYNFRKPERGETIVFATVGTQITQQDQFYIKRLTVLPGERVSIGNDRHMRINGQRLDASTPHFANVYGFDPNKPPVESQYSGHVNGDVSETYGVPAGRMLAPLFPDEMTTYTNGPDSLMVFGDNTCNSADSRSWGTLPTKNVIGKAAFVYWPITSRFGIGPPAN